MAKKALHKLIGSRLIPLQEAVHEIMDYELVISSDIFNYVSLARCQKLQSADERGMERKLDLVTQYIKRGTAHATLSLQQFFYQVFCEDLDVTAKKKRILIGSGLKFKPCYPVDYNYARAILFLHKPWGRGISLNDILADKDLTIRTFLRMIDDKSVPSCVVTQYHMAVSQAEQTRVEVLAQEAMTSDPVIDMMDEEDKDQHLAHENCSKMTDKKGVNEGDMLGGYKVNIGIGYDWSEKNSTINRNVIQSALPKNYVFNTRDEYYEKIKVPVTTPEMLRTPMRKDGKEYTVEDTNEGQRRIVLAAVDTVIKFLTNDPAYKPLRATVMGSAGTGKSFVINTITTILQHLTQCNDTVGTTAPSGGAAFNVGGCTLHRFLKMSIDNQRNKLTEEQKETLRKELKRILVFILDERSMLATEIASRVESILRVTALGGHNSDQYWGGIPVIIVFGDDYQLKPMRVNGGGAIDAFQRSSQQSEIRSSTPEKNYQLRRSHGDYLVVDNLVDSVFMLTENKRVSSGDKDFLSLLTRLREANPIEEDVTRLANLHVSNYPMDFIKKLEEKGNVMYLCYKNDDRILINNEKLRQISKDKNIPIARIDCHYTSTREFPALGHFRNIGYVPHCDICVGAKVSLDQTNIIPEMGLFNGSLGTVVEILYNTREGPNNKQGYHLPEYVIVDFPQFIPSMGLPVWDKNNPTVRIMFT